MKKRNNLHQTTQLACEPKKSKLSDEIVDILPESSGILKVEHCNVHLRPGFSVTAIAFNGAIGRLCVIRRVDQSGKSANANNGQVPADSLSIVEFYNATRPPLIFLEKVIPAIDRFETVIWIDSWAIFGGVGGRATFLSPFTSKFGRIQFCSSDILVMVRTSECQFVLGNNSGELLVVRKRKVWDESDKNNKVPTFLIVQTIKLSSDEHITAIACSKTMKQQTVAVGKVNGLSLLIFEGSQYRKHKEIAIPKAKKNANIIWALVFVDNFLFAGDARGQVCIYNAESGSLLKSLKTHQAPVLALATDGWEVFASGTDFRIQVITSISHNKIRFDWQQCGQRLFHSNDVRSLCVLNRRWMVSGGAEHELFLSDKFHYSNLHVKSECSYSNVNSRHIVSRNLSHLDLWCNSNGETNKAGIERLVRISSGKLGFIKHVCITPNGNFLAFAGAIKGAIRVLKLDSAQISELILKRDFKSKNGENNKLVELYWSNQENVGNGSRAVSAMSCTNNFLYIARGEFTLFRLNLHTKRLQTLAFNDNYGHIVKMCIDQQDSGLLALTTANPLYFDLKNISDAAQNCALSPRPLDAFSNLAPFECLFSDPYRVLFLCASSRQHLICFDLQKDEPIGSLSRDELRLVAPNEWLAYANVNNEKGYLIATSNKGRIRMVTIEKESLRVFTDESSAHKKPEELSKCIDTRIEPFWSGKEASLLLIGYMDGNPPAQKPYHLKFFGKN